jgi:hypothetical protein
MGSTSTAFLSGRLRPAAPLHGVLSTAEDAVGAAQTTTLSCSDLDLLLLETQDALQRSYLFDRGNGLLHRELFLDRLGQAAAGVARGGACFGVLVVGVCLPPWAGTNGSVLAATLGQRLVETGRRSDSFTALDEGCWAGLLIGNHSVAGSVAMAHKLVEQFARPVVAEGRHGVPRAAAGVALCPQHGHEPRRMLLNAHAAMTRALEARQAVGVYAAR